MTCSCLVGFCPLCAGVTYRSTLAHRSGGQEHSPVRPAQVQSLAAKSLCAGQEREASKVFVISHSAPNTAGAPMSDVAKSLSPQSELMSR